MDSPLKHHMEIDNNFESIIQNEDVMQSNFLHDLPSDFKNTHDKFITDGDSIKTFYEKE